MRCYKCGNGVESGRDFIPIEPAGTPNRKWCCTLCADDVEKEYARKSLGEAGINITRKISPNFLLR